MNKLTNVIADASDGAVDLKARQRDVVRLAAGVLAALQQAHVPPALALLPRHQRPTRQMSATWRHSELEMQNRA